jgi:hypothetical protein
MQRPLRQSQRASRALQRLFSIFQACNLPLSGLAYFFPNPVPAGTMKISSTLSLVNV